MMENKIILTSLNSDELKKLISESVAESLKESLNAISHNSNPNTEEELLPRKEVAEIYNVSYVTLRDWEKRGIIPKPIRKASRVYWRRSDIIEDLKKK